ncbi:MAG: hypothetical protein CM1200mP2_44510 [Planctomycetaceae bacterium]|nr:MAG: hypothetical protein CM1200mP2_44510 [Planctomycetaceae bacterium]
MFLATSSIHMEQKLKMDEKQIVKTAVEMVQRAAVYCETWSFRLRMGREPSGLSVRGGRKSDRGRGHDDQYSRYSRIRYAGTVRLGVSTPQGECVEIGQACSVRIATTTWGWPWPTAWPPLVRGLVRSSARSTGWVNVLESGVWEKIVMALATRGDYFECDTKVNTDKLFPTSRLVSSITA